MIAVIHEWMDEGGYEKIFLATEDQDNYDRIRAEFPGKVIAVAQERHSVSEMKKKNSTLHAMKEKGIMLQVTEVGNTFYIDWYQGFAGDMYAKTMRDLMKSVGMNGATLERVE